jgi:hypothetical protein
MPELRRRVLHLLASNFRVLRVLLVLTIRNVVARDSYQHLLDKFLIISDRFSASTGPTVAKTAPSSCTSKIPNRIQICRPVKDLTVSRFVAYTCGSTAGYDCSRPNGVLHPQALLPLLATVVVHSQLINQARLIFNTLVLERYVRDPFNLSPNPRLIWLMIRILIPNTGSTPPKTEHKMSGHQNLT